MNLRYWRKTVIELSNLISNLYDFNSNGSETAKSGIKTTH